MNNHQITPLTTGVRDSGRLLFGAVLMGACLLTSAHASPEKAALFYEDALRRFDQKDLRGSVVQLKNALQEDNRMLAAHLLLGKALLKEGEVKAAEAAFEEALKQGVNRAEVVLPLGQIYLILGRPEAVIERIGTAGLSSSLQVEVLTLRGNAYFEMGNNTLATQSFNQARTLDPLSASPVMAEIPMLLASGQLEKARANAAKAIELAPNNASAWNIYGTLKHLGFDANGALTAYDRALALEPGHVDARVARAGLLIDLKREADARKELDYLVTTAPDEPRAAYLRALLAAKQGDQQATVKALGEIIAIVDALPPKWLARREQILMAGALAHHALGNRVKAGDYAKTLVAGNSRNLAARKLLATVYVESGDYRSALPLLEALQKAAPEDPQVMFLLGSVHMAQRRYQLASELLENAAARTGSAEMNRALAFNQLGLGRVDLGVANLEKAWAADPGDLQAGMTLALIHVRSGQPQKAIQTAEALAKRHPANPAVLNFLASIRMAAGDKSGARAAYMQVLAKDPAFRPAQLNLVKLDVGEQRFDAARRQLDAMLAKRHNDPDALFEYGLLEQAAGRTGEAIRHLKKANEVQRREPRAGLLLVELYLGQQQNGEAMAAAKDLAARFSEDLNVQLALGRVMLANGDAVGARSVFNGATRLAGYNAVAQVGIARWQLAAGNPDGAHHSVQKALQGQPDDLAALVLAVEVDMHHTDAARADAALKVLTTKHPKRVETTLVTADLAMARKQYPLAVAAYRKALAQEESSANALQLARAHVGADEADKAAAFLDGWVKSRPKDLAAQKALAEAQFRAGQLAAARQTYARVSAAAPNEAPMLNNYANLLLQLKDPAAKMVAEKALNLVPDHPSYLDTMGWILVQQGQTEAGLRYLREARLRSPENGEIRFHLAWALMGGGRKDEAREELKAALVGPGRVANQPMVSQLKKELGL